MDQMEMMVMMTSGTVRYFMSPSVLVSLGITILYAPINKRITLSAAAVAITVRDP
jgi:hypothetical protein